MEDDQFDVLQRQASWLAFSARVVQEKYAALPFNLGFTTQLAPDGVSLFNVAHVLAGGGIARNRPATDADLSVRLAQPGDHRRADRYQAGERAARRARDELDPLRAAAARDARRPPAQQHAAAGQQRQRREPDQGVVATSASSPTRTSPTRTRGSSWPTRRKRTGSCASTASASPRRPRCRTPGPGTGFTRCGFGRPGMRSCGRTSTGRPGPSQATPRVARGACVTARAPIVPRENLFERT